MESHDSRGATAPLTGQTHADRPSVAALSGYIMVAACLGLVAFALARGHAIVALLLACLLTLGVTAVVQPRAYRYVAWVGVAAVPFATAWTLLHPDLYDMPLYLSVFIMLLVGLGVFQTRVLPRTMGTVYLGYIILAAFVSVFSAFGPGGLGRISAIVIAFGAYVLLFRAGRRERRFVLALLLGMCFIEAVLAVLQSVFGWPVFPAQLATLIRSDRNYIAYLVPGMNESVTQGSGTFYHFNALGGVLAPAVPVAFGLWMGRLRSPLRLVILLVLLAGTVATFSRGALLGSVAGILFVAFFEQSRSRRVMMLLVVCAVFVASLLALSTATQYYQTTENVGIRAQTWRLAVTDALERPSSLLFGYGYDYFHTVLSAGTGGDTRAIKSTVMPGVHSGPLQLALEFGLVGAILFALWMLTASQTGLGTNRSPLTVALLGGAVAFLFHQVLDTSMFLYPGVLFVIVVGLAEAEARAPEDGSTLT